MKLSPLELKGIFFTKVDVSAVPNADENDVDKITVEPTLDLSERQSGDGWFVFLSVRIVPSSPKSPYTGTVELCGRFVVSQSWSKADAQKLVYVNGGGILYSAAREIVSTLTARGFYGVLTLPSLSFFEMFKEDEIRRNQPTLPFESQESAEKESSTS